MDLEEVEEIVPSTLSLYFWFPNNERLNFNLKKVVQNYMEDFQEKVDSRHMIGMYKRCDDDEDKHFEIYIGKRLVLSGLLSEEDDVSGYLTKIINGVLDHYYFRILELEKENIKKVSEIEKSGDLEFMFTYTRFHDKDNHFFYMKKIASLYPSYKRNLLRGYHGVFGDKHKSLQMSTKMERNKDECVQDY